MSQVAVNSRDVRRIRKAVRDNERAGSVPPSRVHVRSIDDYWVQVTNATLTGGFYPGKRLDLAPGSTTWEEYEAVKIVAVGEVPDITTKYRGRRHGRHSSGDMIYSIRVEANGTVSENSTLNNATLNGNTTVNDNATVNADVILNGANVLAANGTLELQGQITLVGPQNHTVTGNVTLSANGTLTMTFTGAGALVVCGNTTFCANKTVTVPELIGNGNGGTLMKLRPSTGNASNPGQIQLLNGVVEVTGVTGTPTTPANGTYGVFVDDADGKLYLIDSTGAEYPVANTGNGTSAGAEGDVQFASAVSGEFDFENGGPTYVYRYDKTAHELTVPGLKIIPVPGGGGTLIISALGVVSADTDGSSTVYAPSTPSDWDGTDPDNVRDAIDRLAAAVAGLLGTAIP